jgi:hypothetical protein
LGKTSCFLWVGRDRSAARTTVGGAFPALALSIREVGASFPHGPRFRRPPYDPGQWDGPSPVLTLASRRSPSHTTRRLRADSHTPLRSMVCFHGRSMVRRPSHVRGLLELPSAPSPLARAGRYRARRGLVDPVSRCDPAVIAPTDSCASPPPSSCLGATRGHHVCAGGCQPLLGRGPSRRSLCTSFPACLDLSPGGSCGASTRFCPHDSGLPPVRTGSALHHVRPATAVRRPLRGCRHVFLCRPAGVLTTQVAPTATVSARRAAVVSPSEPLVGRYLPTPRICSPSASGH